MSQEAKHASSTLTILATRAIEARGFSETDARERAQWLASKGDAIGTDHRGALLILDAERCRLAGLDDSNATPRERRERRFAEAEKDLGNRLTACRQAPRKPPSIAQKFNEMVNVDAALRGNNTAAKLGRAALRKRLYKEAYQAAGLSMPVDS